jgi:hypothetical protein
MSVETSEGSAGGGCWRGLAVFVHLTTVAVRLSVPPPAAQRPFFPPSASAHVPGRGPRPLLLLGGCAVIAPGRPSPSVRGDWAEEPSVGRHGPRTGSMGTQRQRNAGQERRHSLLKKKCRGAILFIFYSKANKLGTISENERNNNALSTLHCLRPYINLRMP